MALASRRDSAQQAAGNPIAYAISHLSTMAMASSILPRRILHSFHSSSFDALHTTDRTFMDLSPYLPVQMIGAGLANLGNTCFLNSVLQCLTYTPPLAAHLQHGFHKISCQNTGFCAMCALESHVKEALASHGRIISPRFLVKNLSYISRSFQICQQEDAHEYMRYLIEALQNCSSAEVSGGKSLIQNVFGGQLRSQVKCTRCSHCSNKYDPFLDLSLEVVEADSLQTALAHFTAIEVLDGDNKYHCSKCRTKVRALKQFTINNAPPVLTIQLKRFSNFGGYGGKIDKKVHFDKKLNLKPFMNGGEGGDVKYTLYAVLVHSGWSVHSGHYYCFVRTAIDTWYLLDDNKVSQVSERTVLEQKAYILLYMRDPVEVTKLHNAEQSPRSNTKFLKQNVPYEEENLHLKKIFRSEEREVSEVPRNRNTGGLSERSLSVVTGKIDTEIVSETHMKMTASWEKDRLEKIVNDETHPLNYGDSLKKVSCEEGSDRRSFEHTDMCGYNRQDCHCDACDSSDIVNAVVSDFQGSVVLQGIRSARVSAVLSDLDPMHAQHLDVLQKETCDRQKPVQHSSCLSLPSSVPVSKPRGRSLLGIASKQAVSMLSECAELFLWSCLWTSI